MNKNQPLNTPTRILMERRLHRLCVEWPDGQIHYLDLSLLRQQCPCALCDDVRERQKMNLGLHMISQDETPLAEISEIVPVGNYAIQIRWEDGHDTGIYTYRLLKEMGQTAVS